MAAERTEDTTTTTTTKSEGDDDRRSLQLEVRLSCVVPLGNKRKCLSLILRHHRHSFFGRGCRANRSVGRIHHLLFSFGPFFMSTMKESLAVVMLVVSVVSVLMGFVLEDYMFKYR